MLEQWVVGMLEEVSCEVDVGLELQVLVLVVVVEVSVVWSVWE